MKPKHIIEQLAAGTPGKPGRLILEQPITNIPVGDSDYHAGKLMDFVINQVMEDESLMQDILILLADVSHALAAIEHDTPYTASAKAIKIAEFIERDILDNTGTYIEKVIAVAETQWWIVFFAAFGREKPYESILDLRS